MKRILGLDLGTTSIGWAFVNEAEEDSKEISSIIKTGVRVIPISTDEQNDFKKGNSITTNANRTLKRGMRRNLHRYKLRRAGLLEVLERIGFIDESSILSEDQQHTHTMWNIRAKAPNERLSKTDIARVFLMINKKRGYKSSRKANNQEDGQLIDGMGIAKRLYNENLTPGELSYILLKEGKKKLPDYYKSDLQAEFDLIWNFQQQFYPIALTQNHKEAMAGLNKTQTGQYFEKTIEIERAENKGKEKRIQAYKWRSKAKTEQLELTVVAYVLTEIVNQINQSSGYLGAISDRSKELFFNEQTIGQYIYEQLKENHQANATKQTFYRQDYIDEFDAIWKEQSKYYSELTDDIKLEIKDHIIFYQRKLKSQKGLISICELEGKEQEVLIGEVKKKRIIGPRVAPKSSPVFQQAKVWGDINNISIVHKKNKEEISLEEDIKELLFNELNIIEGLSDKGLLSLLNKVSDINGKEWEVNLKKIEGNRTQATLFNVYKEILEIEGYDAINYKKPASEIIENIASCFREIGINPDILSLDMTLRGNDFAKQPAYQLWHLLYSYESDNSLTGNISLLKKLENTFGFKQEHAQLLVNIVFQTDYGNLSVRALRKIYPFLEEGKGYSEACALVGYDHATSLTKEQNSTRPLDEKLETLSKNALRNPVVEKILNQMINVVNMIINHPELGPPDEIRIELARELKKTAKQRKEMTTAIGKSTRDHIVMRTFLREEVGLKYVSRKDLIKYKLYLELKANGFKTLYSGTYITLKDLFFTKKFDIEHILPKAVLFDDSFSNKTIELRDINLEKSNDTAYDYCVRKGSLSDFENRVELVFNQKGIKYGKYKKLLMKKEDIPTDFLNRDIGNTAYIAKKAQEILKKVVRDVFATSGTITDKLRSDWELINVLQELNWDKYEMQGMTYYEYNKENKALPRIKGWTKRNDHRHHAMDAITIAFTKQAFVNYLNNMNSESTKGTPYYGIKEKYTYRDKNNNGGRKFKKPFKNIREEAKKQLLDLLISHKAKNKVVTLNKNKIKVKGGYDTKTGVTPRGQLHKETIYGKSKYYVVKEEKVNASFTEEKITQVTKPLFRNALSKRLQEYDNDPKKAFTGKNSLTKNPILLDSSLNNVPDIVKTQQLITRFTIRKEITPDLKVDKVVDEKIKMLLKERLASFNDNPKKAFVNLDQNPILFGKQEIKRVTITGVTNAVPLHYAKDHNGDILLDSSGSPIPTDYVQLGNNHHIAVFQGPDGELDDEGVSFYEAVIRKNKGISIVSPQNQKGWPLLFTLKQNEMFVFPSEEFKPKEIDLTNRKNKTIISKNLFRVQKISKVIYGNSAVREYVFRHHLETEVNDVKELKDITWKPIKSLGHLKEIVKVRLNHLGEIVQINEY